MADFLVDGIVTEYKGVISSGLVTVKNAIEEAVKQSKEGIVIDARRTAVTAESALSQIGRAAGNIAGNLQGRVTVLTTEVPPSITPDQHGGAGARSCSV